VKENKNFIEKNFLLSVSMCPAEIGGGFVLARQPCLACCST